RPDDVVEAAAARPLLLDAGVGITNLVARASARADELEPDEIIAGYRRLAQVAVGCRPTVVAFLGITSYRIVTGNRRAKTGPQPSPWPGTQVWVAPNPSGLNAHATLESLAT